MVEEQLRGVWLRVVLEIVRGEQLKASHGLDPVQVRTAISQPTESIAVG